MSRASERRRGRPVLVICMLLLMLLALLVVADRVADRVAERRVAQQLRRQLGNGGRPEVDIEGFPYLTPALSGRFTSVHVVDDNIVAPGSGATNGRPVLLRHLDVRLHPVTSSDRFRTAKAGQVDGTATIDYPTVQQLTKQPLTFASGGRVEARVPTTVAGIQVTADVVGKPVLDVGDQTLTLADPQMSVAGVEVPSATAQALLGQVLKPVPITGLPFGASLTSITATEQGLVAGVTASEVALTR